MAVTLQSNRHLLTNSSPTQREYLSVRKEAPVEKPLGNDIKVALFFSSLIPGLAFLWLNILSGAQQKQPVTISYHVREVSVADYTQQSAISTPDTARSSISSLGVDPNMVHIRFLQERDNRNRELESQLDALSRENARLIKEFRELDETYKNSTGKSKHQNGEILEILKKQNEEIKRLRAETRDQAKDNDLLASNVLQAKENIKVLKSEVQQYKDKIARLNFLIGKPVSDENV